MSIRTHFCVVQCYSQLGWLVIKGGKPIWNPDPHPGFVDAFGLGAAAWILWLRDEYGTFEKVSCGGRVLRIASATIERQALRMGIEHLTVLFPTEVSTFDFQVECTDSTNLIFTFF